MVDAECPRCSATSPPPESLLATCKRCGLVFLPHEVQSRPPLPTSGDDVELDLPQPPAGVTVRREGDAITIVWPLARYVTAFIFSAGMFLAYLAATLHPEQLTSALWGSVIFCAGVGIVQLFAHHVITLRRDAVEHHISFTFGTRTVRPLDRVRGVELRKSRWALYQLHVTNTQRRAGTLVARSIERAPLDYAANLIASRIPRDS
jgi:hypothetical protein